MYELPVKAPPGELRVLAKIFLSPSTTSTPPLPIPARRRTRKQRKKKIFACAARGCSEMILNPSDDGMACHSDINTWSTSGNQVIKGTGA